MVPGSTLRYGSNFIMLTRSPRLSSRQPMEAAARPLPRLDTTPPVTKTYFADIDATSELNCWVWPYLVGTFKYDRDWDARKQENNLHSGRTGEAPQNLFGFKGLRRHPRRRRFVVQCIRMVENARESSQPLQPLPERTRGPTMLVGRSHR